MTIQARASDIVLGATDLGSAMADLANLAVEMIGDCCAFFMLDPASGALRLAELRGRNQRAVTDVTSALIQRPPFVGEGFVGNAVHANEPLVLPDLTAESAAWRRKVAPAESQLVRRFDLRSLIGVPLRGSVGPIGGMLVGWSQGGRHVALEDARLVEELARRATWALEQHRFVRALEEALERLEQVLNSMAAGLIIWAATAGRSW